MNSDSRASFEKVVKTYHDDLSRYAYWLCKDMPLAHDLVQETFLRAWKAFDRLRDVKAVKSWLITILRREYARTFEKKVPDLVDIDDQILQDTDIETMDQQSESRFLRKAMASLPEKYREPLMLQVVMGYSCQEIADQLDISKSAVMTQLFRARVQLKERFDDLENEQE